MKVIKPIILTLLCVVVGSAVFSGCKSPDEQPKIEYVQTEEFYSQVAYYGNDENERTNTCMRIGFSVKMKAETLITFLGDPEVYKFAVCESQNVSDPSSGYLLNSGWLETDVYALSQDCFPMPIIARVDGAKLSNEELVTMHSLLKVEGEKIAPKTADDGGELTEEEYLAQIVHFGSVPNPTTNTRMRISFAIRMQKGSTVKFIGNSNEYKWAVVEAYNTAHVNGCLDSGWNTSWSSPNADHVINMDGSYPILTVAKKDDSALSKEDFKQIHSMFKVEGQKWTEHNLEQTSDSSIKAVNHRGYSMKAPENTLAAYRESALHGFKIVECDVWFTSDNQAVLLHDETIDRTSNGSGKIEKMTLNQVRQYDFGSWKDSEYIGEKIPTFSEFMELCQELELHPYIELKSGLSLEKARSLVNTVKNYGMLDNVSWISFGSDSLKNIVVAYNKARVGYLVSDITSGVISTANNLKTGYNEVFIDCNISNVTESDVTLCKNASYPLEVWTVNKPSDVSKINSYISGVTSDWMIIGDYLKK